MTRRGGRERFDAVVFDMDGVLLDTESAWHEVRRDFALQQGGHWTEDDQRAVMGMNSEQWSVYMRDMCGVPLSPREIYVAVVRNLRRRYESRLPLYPGAVEVVESLAGDYRLAVASSSPQELIDAAVGAAGLSGLFIALVSSDEVARGKPEPDVYLAACDRLGVDPARAVAVEDSTNGIRAAAAAGLTVVAVPNAAFPPSDGVVGLAVAVLSSISDLTPELVQNLAPGGGL